VLIATLLLSVTLQVPRGIAPTIDGSIAADEWNDAARVELTNGGEAHLKHDGMFLYIAITGAGNGIGSLCAVDGKDIRILHASAALGTAVFRDGKATRGFTWTNRDTGDMAARKRFLDAEQWFANATPRANPEREYQIRIDGRKEIPLTLAFLSIDGDATKMHVWPAEVDDACADAKLAGGWTEGQFVFDPQRWGVLALK